MVEEREWFVRTEDGSVYGPTDLQSLVQWAKDGRIEPTSFVSSDRVSWMPAPQKGELGMTWLVEVEQGKVYGPFARSVVSQLFSDGSVPKSARVYRLHEGAVDQDPPPVEKVVTKEVRVEVPVEKIVKVPVEKIVEREVRVEVPVEKIVTKEVRVEVPVEKIVKVPVEKIVEREVRVEVPVEKVVTKEVRVEVPVEKVVTKEVRVEVPVEKIVKVPVEKIVEKEVIREVRVEVPVERIVEKIVEVPAARVEAEVVVPEVVEPVVSDSRPAESRFETAGRDRLAALEAAARRELASARGRRFAGTLFGRK